MLWGVTGGVEPHRRGAMRSLEFQNPMIRIQGNFKLQNSRRVQGCLNVRQRNAARRGVLTTEYRIHGNGKGREIHGIRSGKREIRRGAGSVGRRCGRGIKSGAGRSGDKSAPSGGMPEQGQILRPPFDRKMNRPVGDHLLGGDVCRDALRGVSVASNRRRFRSFCGLVCEFID